MKINRVITILFLLLILMAFSACKDDSDKNEDLGTLKLQLTDAPADVMFEAVTIDFDRIEIKRAGDEFEEEEELEEKDSGWMVMNEDGGTVDLLQLNNGKLYELGVKDLEPGQYNQIRFYVSKASVTVEGEIVEMKLASSTVKLVRPFTIEAGITTELIADFNALKSIKKTGKGYLMTPVIRLIEKKTTGGIEGKVTEPAEGLIAVTSFKEGEPDSYSGTVADETGYFLLGYMEPGIYSVVVEAEGYKPFTSENVEVTEGNIIDLGEIQLEESGGDEVEIETGKGMLILSLTDAPAEEEFEAVTIDFDRIEINRAEEGFEEEESLEEDGSGWMVLNEDGGTVDLLQLNNGKLYELGVEDLEPGQYNQIRFYVSRASVTVDGEIVEMKLASSTVKLVRPFTIKEGVVTELIADFDALKSIKKTGKGYLMTPVIRLMEKDTTGGIKGEISEPTEGLISVTSFKEGEKDSYSGTVTDEKGEFLLAYMEPGIYTVVIESAGFKPFVVEGVDVVVGEITNLNKIVGEINLEPEGEGIENTPSEQEEENGDSDVEDSGPQVETGMLSLSLTDAPAKEMFEAVIIEFEKIDIIKAGEGWIPFNENSCSVDLLKLNNGTLYHLGLKNLEPGQYNQIRFHVSKASVVIDGEELEIKLASSTVKLVRPFTIEQGKTTELVADFDALKSIKKTGKGYLMTPVIRLVQIESTGGIEGEISEPTEGIISVKSYIEGSPDSYSGTVTDGEV